MILMKKRIRSLILLAAMLCLPRLAYAQYTHAITGTTPTLTCTNTTGTTYSTDVFTETLTGNTTYTLPAAAAGCNVSDRIELLIEQATSGTYTVDVASGTGNYLDIPSGGLPDSPSCPSASTDLYSNCYSGSFLTMPKGTGSTLHQTWIYNSTLATPTWELVMQETLPPEQLPMLPPIFLDGVPQSNCWASASSVLVTLPTKTYAALDNLLVCMNYNTTQLASAPTGWATSVAEPYNSNADTCACFDYNVQDGNPGASATWTFGGASAGCWVAIAYTHGLIAGVAGESNTTGTGTTYTAGSVTGATVVPGTWYDMAACSISNSGVFSSPTTGNILIQTNESTVGAGFGSVAITGGISNTWGTVATQSISVSPSSTGYIYGLTTAPRGW